MTVDLVRYEAVCKALAEARSIDEVKDIRDKAIAIKAYARQAKNKDLEADAWEIRRRAERRLGEMMEAQRQTIGFNKGGGDHRVIEKPGAKATLASQGIDKNLADRARQLQKLSNEDFEQHIADGRADVRLSAERATHSKIIREEKHQGIAAAANKELSNKGPFPLIYADPPWKWGHFGEQDKENEAGKARTPDQHYPTMTHDEILNYGVDGRSVAEISHDDAALFLWCTSSNIPRALEVMKRWGFEFKSSAAWMKMKDGRLQTGTGLVFRNGHELLLYGSRGKMPGPQWQPPSIFVAPRGKHSAKPNIVRIAIEKMYPDFDARTRLELFARGRAEGWTAYGYEVPKPNTDFHNVLTGRAAAKITGAHDVAA